jgi:ribonuclease HI
MPLQCRLPTHRSPLTAFPANPNTPTTAAKATRFASGLPYGFLNMLDQHPLLAPLTAGRHYLIATDGACIPNPGPGGWGLIKQLKEGARVLRQLADAGHSEVAFGEPTPTNNRMEMMAAIKAVEGVAEAETPAIIISDSEYVVLNMTERLPGWKANGWKISKGAVKNRDLWEHLDAACAGKIIHWVWVKGHAGYDLNEMANTIADNAARGKYPKGRQSVKAVHPGWFIG